MNKKTDDIEKSVNIDDEKSAEEAAEDIIDDIANSTSMILRKPVMYNGEEIKELTFDFNKLTGADALNIENELNSIGKQVITATSSADFLVRMARNACEQAVGVDFFKMVSIVDYNKIITKARFFLLGYAN